MCESYNNVQYTGPIEVDGYNFNWVIIGVIVMNHTLKKIIIILTINPYVTLQLIYRIL